VLLDHAELPVGNIAGVAGVTAFFVLSGYVITGVLVSERAEIGRIDLRAFYARRVRRLLPAFAVMAGFVAVLGVGGRWASLWDVSVLTGSLYVGNWWTAAGLSTDLPASHAWSLNIEEQFYALWPLVLVFASRRSALMLCAAGIVAAVALRSLTPEAFAAHASVTRIDGLLAGCAIALLRIRWHWLLGVAGMVILGEAAYGANLTPDLFRAFGPNVPAATLLAVIGATLIVGSSVHALGTLAPVGKRAYGIYLWSWPLTLLVGGLAAIPLTLIAAELSYGLVETRFRYPRDARIGEGGYAQSPLAPERSFAAEPSRSAA
jgi:peptidoglycan/LPS O-acetylase OafA/YrhL